MKHTPSSVETMAQDKEPALHAAGEDHKALQELTKKHVNFRLENTVLSEHLTRLITRKGSDHFHLQLEALEEDIRQSEDGSESQRTRRSTMKSPQEYGEANSGQSSRFGSLHCQELSIGTQPSFPPEFSLLLSLEEKCEIAEVECTSIRDQIKRYRNESECVLDDLKAVIEETENSIEEIKRENSCFQREVLFEAVLRNSKFASSDRIISYLQEKAKTKRSLIAKLQDKNDNLQSQIADAERQYATKKDLADILHSVDFDQLAIQNQQLQSKIFDHTHELRRLNVNNRKASQAKLKDILDIDTQESDAPSYPNALEYMHAKGTVQVLRKELNKWQKKVNVFVTDYIHT
eukprot:c23579_g1_i3 orf=153-1196(-)